MKLILITLFGYLAIVTVQALAIKEETSTKPKQFDLTVVDGNFEHTENFFEDDVDLLNEDEDYKLKNQTNRKLCRRKYYSGLRQSLRSYKKSIKLCRSSENESLCKKNAKEQFETNVLKIVEQFLKCMEKFLKKSLKEIVDLSQLLLEDDEEVVEVESNFRKGNSTARRLCFRKYHDAYRQIRQNYQKSMKLCRFVPKKFECQQNASLTFKNETLKAENKLRECIRATCKNSTEVISNSIENFDNVDYIIDDEELDDDFDILDYDEVDEDEKDDTEDTDKRSPKKICKQKFRYGASKLRKNFRTEIKKCRTSRNKRICKRIVRNKYRNEKFKLRVDLKECLLAASNKTVIEYLENLNENDLKNFTFQEDNEDSKKLNCKLKFTAEFLNILKKFVDEKLKCKESANRKECAAKVFIQFVQDSNQVLKKVKDCISKNQ